jgi:hypothetical protein
MKENHLEDACLDWLVGVGWTVVEGDAVAPGGELEARERWSEVVLASRLQVAVARLNPALTPTEVEAVVAKVTGYGHQSLVDGNREMYDWLRNGVPLERTASDGRREVLRVPVIDFVGANDKDSRARMVAMVKVLLATHKYPPDKQPEAIEKVIAQAELLADSWGRSTRAGAAAFDPKRTFTCDQSREP